MKVLFIGGTGVISTSVSELAAKNSNIDLYLLNRGNQNGFAPSGATLIRGDIRDKENITSILKKFDFDVVVDWIAYTPDQVKVDIEFFSGRIRQYIFISSASAYQKPPSHLLIDESTPLYNPYWRYSQDKIACEELLMNKYRKVGSAGFPVTIVRPNYTYDKTMIPFIFNSRKYRWTLIDRMRKGKKIIVPGDGTSLFTITHSKDFAKGFVGLIGNTKAIGHAFHITTDEVNTWNQFTNAIGAAAGVKPDIMHIPSELISAISPEHMGGLIGDKSQNAVFDNNKIKTFVPGYQAKIRFEEGIRDTISWYEANPALCQVDEEFNALSDRIIMQMNKAYGI